MRAKEVQVDSEKLRCTACGAIGVGIGFDHKCDPTHAKRERARVVAWLRAETRVGLDTRVLADAIERGEHLS